MLSLLFLSISISRATITPRLLISGAGPAGLSAGIAALEAGAHEVLIVEKRSRSQWATRQRSVFVSDVTAATLERLGVRPRATPISHWHVVRSGRQRVLPNKGHWRDEIFARLFHRRFDAIVSIADVERAMLERYLTLGGRIQFDRPFRPGDEQGSADLILIAEGTKSPTREALGFDWEASPVGESPAYLSTDFRRPATGRPGGCFFFIGDDGRLDGYGCRADGFGTFGLIHPERFDDETRRAKLDEMARQVGVDRDDLESPAPHVGALKYAPRVRRGRVFLIGDSARSTDPSSSSGMATAIEDALRVGRYVGSFEIPAAGDDFARSILRNTEVCFEKALYFQDLFAWGNRKLARVWGAAPVGRLNDPRSVDSRWSIHDGYYRVGSWLPKGLQRHATNLIVHLVKGPKTCPVSLETPPDDSPRAK